MAVRTASTNPAVLSYYAMRRAVGIIALSMPVALPAGCILVGLLGPAHALPHPLLERSISDYYYTPMRNYLIGCLFAMAAFLAGSRGYDLEDEVAGYVACALTLGVALFPSVNPRSSQYTVLQVRVGFVHTGFAALMFLVLAYFCVFLFTRSAGRPQTARKSRRNRIYVACGFTIMASTPAIVLLTAGAWARGHRPSPLLFWCESLALVAFGIAWLTKGEGILKDRPHNHLRAL